MKPRWTMTQRHHWFVAPLLLVALLGLHPLLVPKDDIVRDLSSTKSSQLAVAAELSSLNDPTMAFSPSVDHLWPRYYGNLRQNQTQAIKPKVRLLLTDFGWNHPDPNVSISFYRSTRSQELLQGFLDHPNFDSTIQWSQIMKNNTEPDITLPETLTDPAVQTIVLLDLETCFEDNYPHYAVRRKSVNADLRQGRPYKKPKDNPCWFYEDCLVYVNQVLDSPLFQHVPSATLAFLDCSGEWDWVRRRFPQSLRHANLTTQQLSFVSISASHQIIREESDMGLPPPAIHPVVLEPNQVNDIATCSSELEQEGANQRKYFFSFIGHERKEWSPSRSQLLQLNNDQDILVKRTKEFDSQKQGGTFDSILRQSRYAGTPRGDCLFSYRFTEVLSAGAIPVVYADGWVLAFRPELVDWQTECAIIIPEQNASQTMEILNQITPEEQCQRRQKCYEIYNKYLATPAGTINGIVESIVVLNAAKKEKRGFS